MPFRQEPPRLGNQYEDDRALRSYLKRTLPPEVLRHVDLIADTDPEDAAALMEDR